MAGPSSIARFPNVAKLREVAASLATQAGQLAVEMHKQATVSAETKSSATDLVTVADRAAERLIVDGLARMRPEDGTQGEEGANGSGTSGVVWHIDPIDGTTNYVYGLPYCVSIAATYEPQEPAQLGFGKPQLLAGAVYNPNSSELFSAAVDEGATCNDQVLTANKTDELSQSLVATGFAYDAAERRRQAEKLTHVIGEVRDIRRIGAAALDLCSVAAGSVDAYYENGLNFWDMAAGIVIAREAGALVTDVAGSDPTSKSLVAAAPAVHLKLLQLLQDVEQLTS